MFGVFIFATELHYFSTRDYGKTAPIKTLS